MEDVGIWFTICLLRCSRASLTVQYVCLEIVLVLFSMIHLIWSFVRGKRREERICFLARHSWLHGSRSALLSGAYIRRATANTFHVVPACSSKVKSILVGLLLLLLPLLGPLLRGFELTNDGCIARCQLLRRLEIYYRFLVVSLSDRGLCPSE